MFLFKVGVEVGVTGFVIVMFPVLSNNTIWFSVSQDGPRGSGRYNQDVGEGGFIKNTVAVIR